MLTTVTDLTDFDLELILEESQAQGFRMVRRLVDEWRSGVMSFSGPKELLLAHVDGRRVLGIGGICEEPYLHLPQYGRIRHLYVVKSSRKQGIGRLLLTQILEFARTHYELVTTRTPKDGSADGFYERLGFVLHEGLETVSHVYECNTQRT